MKSKKKLKKVSKKAKKTENTSLAEGDVVEEKSCITCHFLTKGVIQEFAWCKRHREYLKDLYHKKIIAGEEPVCRLWHVNTR